MLCRYDLNLFYMTWSYRE